MADAHLIGAIARDSSAPDAAQMALATILITQPDMLHGSARSWANAWASGRRPISPAADRALRDHPATLPLWAAADRRTVADLADLVTSDRKLSAKALYAAASRTVRLVTSDGARPVEAVPIVDAICAAGNLRASAEVLQVGDVAANRDWFVKVGRAAAGRRLSRSVVGTICQRLLDGDADGDVVAVWLPVACDRLRDPSLISKLERALPAETAVPMTAETFAAAVRVMETYVETATALAIRAGNPGTGGPTPPFRGGSLDSVGRLRPVDGWQSTATVRLLTVWLAHTAPFRVASSLAQTVEAMCASRQVTAGTVRLLAAAARHPEWRPDVDRLLAAARLPGPVADVFVDVVDGQLAEMWPAHEVTTFEEIISPQPDRRGLGPGAWAQATRMLADTLERTDPVTLMQVLAKVPSTMPVADMLRAAEALVGPPAP